MWRRGFLLPLIFLAGCALALLGIIQVWVESDQAPDKSLSRKGPEVPKAVPLRDQRPLNAFTVVSSKNLFSPSRTGPGLGAVTAKAKSSLEGRRLLGVIIVGDEKAALISAAPGPAVRGRGPAPVRSQIDVVRLGDEWEGFKVVEISSEAVVFQSKEGKKTLNFPE